MNLFNQKKTEHPKPLADRLRPRNFSEFVGQAEIVGTGRLLRQAIESDQLPSMIFWGPPGCGKTTLAGLIAKITQLKFKQLSAVTSGIKDLRAIIKEARNLETTAGRTILFMDEIHRWNKAQQDGLLPHVENGTIILIGATTENPSFTVIAPLLSRTRVFILKKLSGQNIADILVWALNDKERGLGNLKIKITPEIIKHLALLANGDARIALNALELGARASQPNSAGLIELKEKNIKEALQKTHLLYDRAGEEHYNIISALHKSLRGSAADAALYWLGRMLEAGEDPLYVARRLVRFASEDVGLADPQALVQAVAAYQAAHFLGRPECNVHLAQAVVYLARAPKSNELYRAYSEVQKDIKETENDPVPLYLRNAPTELMQNLGYGKGYKYNPDYEQPVEQDYLPPRLKGRKYL